MFPCYATRLSSSNDGGIHLKSKNTIAMCVGSALLDMIALGFHYY